MPQMMPMLWMIMFSFTLSILLLIIILLHFLNLPMITITSPFSTQQKICNLTQWTWLW